METKKLTKIEESEYFWQNTYQLKYYEMDFKMTLKPSALLNFLQDVATINAELLGFGYSFVHPKNYGWFLIKYHMEFDEYPSGIDEIIIKTEARGISKILANRDFEIWTSDNKKRLGRVASQWMMIDLNTKNILPLAKIVDFMPHYEKRENDLLFNKIAHPENITLEETFKIRFDDIDANRHVNNANYFAWAFETLPWEFKAEHKLKTLDIVYKKEILFGNNVISQAEIAGKTSTHVLKNATTNEDLCLIKALWV